MHPLTGATWSASWRAARGARRLLPWALATAARRRSARLRAGGGPRAGAASVAAVGLLFVLFLWATSIARCPACGAPLRQKSGRTRGATGPAAVERARALPALPDPVRVSPAPGGGQLPDELHVR